MSTGKQLPMGDISAMHLVWDYAGAGVILTPHLGTANLRMEDTVNSIHVEGWGDSEIDAVFGGTIMELEVPFARSSLAKLETILLGVLDAPNKKITISAKSGCAMYEDAKEIVIKPECDGVAETDQAKWIHLYHCYPYRKWELSYDRSTQKVFMTGFKIFISQTSGREGDFGTVGV